MFPLEFAFIRVVSDPFPLGPCRYIVGAMMTPSHANLGERLAASCRAHSLPLALFEVPSVHRSISLRGTDDLRYTKANFVHFLLRRYACPVLYLDVDCVIAQRPILTERLLAGQVDFAIFNWLSEEHTEAYSPVSLDGLGAGRTPINGRRFYRFSHSVDLHDRTQLFCSGPVQWYADSKAAKCLLEHWHDVIRRSPHSPDDKCLDFAYNNYAPSAAPMRSVWLDKSYARYAWWIYVRPVIDHPDFPYQGEGFAPLNQLDGKQRIYPETVQQIDVRYVFPKDCLIDTQASALLRLRNGKWTTAGHISTPLWL